MAADNADNADDVAELATATWRQLKDLAVDGVRLQGRYARAVASTVAAAARGDTPDVKEVASTVGQEWRDYANELARINLRYARSVQDLAAGTAERVIDAVQPRRPAPTSRTPTARKRAGRTGGATGSARGRRTPPAPA